MTRSWHARRVVTAETIDTIADGVAGRHPIRAVLDDLLQVADDAVLVAEASIVAGMRMLLEHAGLVVEPSAALGVAAVLEDTARFAGRHVVTIICGGNVGGPERLPGLGPRHRDVTHILADGGEDGLPFASGTRSAAERSSHVAPRFPVPPFPQSPGVGTPRPGIHPS